MSQLRLTLDPRARPVPDEHPVMQVTQPADMSLDRASAADPEPDLPPAPQSSPSPPAGGTNKHAHLTPLHAI
jgi:hypothetical protein